MANYIKAGHFEASGASVTLTLPKERVPDYMMMWNETKFATDATNIMMLWNKDFAAGDASILLNEADAGIGVKETTNAITQADSVAYTETNSTVRAVHTLTLTIGPAFYGADSDEVHYLMIWADEFEDHGDINA